MTESDRELPRAGDDTGRIAINLEVQALDFSCPIPAGTALAVCFEALEESTFTPRVEPTPSA
jgi:hypothetical protein